MRKVVLNVTLDDLYVYAPLLGNFICPPRLFGTDDERWEELGLRTDIDELLSEPIVSPLRIVAALGNENTELLKSHGFEEVVFNHTRDGWFKTFCELFLAEWPSKSDNGWYNSFFELCFHIKVIHELYPDTGLYLMDCVKERYFPSATELTFFKTIMEDLYSLRVGKKGCSIEIRSSGIFDEMGVDLQAETLNDVNELYERALNGYVENRSLLPLIDFLCEHDIYGYQRYIESLAKLLPLLGVQIDNDICTALLDGGKDYSNSLLCQLIKARLDAENDPPSDELTVNF